MSIQYKIAEAKLNGSVKKELYESLEQPQNRNDVPDFIHNKFDVEKLEFGEHCMFKIAPRKDPDKTAIMLITGGAGFLPPNDLHFKTAAALIKETNATIFIPFYPLAPKATVRIALHYLQRAWSEILRDFLAQNVTFLGDGIGANLALGLCNRVNRKPGHIVAISPMPGIGQDAWKETFQEEEKNDPVLSMEMADKIESVWYRNIPQGSADREVLCMPYKGFPPTLLIYGSKDMFSKSTDTLVQKIGENGATVQILKKDMFHSWALRQNFPETKIAMQQIAAFIGSGTHLEKAHTSDEKDE